MSALSAHVLEEIKELPGKYPQPRSAVMPALDLAQEELGHLTPEAMTEVAEALELDPGYVEGVATFYSLFHLEPIGKHHFYVCTNLSCMIRGAYDIVDHIKKSTGVSNPDEVSADGLFSYEEVECLGACEYAPMMRLDHRYQYDLTPAKIDELITAAKAPSPPRGEGRGTEPKAPSPPRGEGRGTEPKAPSPPRGKGREAEPKAPSPPRGEGRGTEPKAPSPPRGKGRGAEPKAPSPPRGEGGGTERKAPSPPRGEGRGEGLKPVKPRKKKTDG